MRGEEVRRWAGFIQTAPTYTTQRPMFAAQLIQNTCRHGAHRACLAAGKLQTAQKWARLPLSTGPNSPSTACNWMDTKGLMEENKDSKDYHVLCVALHKILLYAHIRRVHQSRTVRKWKMIKILRDWEIAKSKIEINGAPFPTVFFLSF